MPLNNLFSIYHTSYKSYYYLLLLPKTEHQQSVYIFTWQRRFLPVLLNNTEFACFLMKSIMLSVNQWMPFVAMVLLKRSRAPVFKADHPFLFILRRASGGKGKFLLALYHIHISEHSTICAPNFTLRSCRAKVFSYSSIFYIWTWKNFLLTQRYTVILFAYSTFFIS